AADVHRHPAGSAKELKGAVVVSREGRLCLKATALTDVELDPQTDAAENLIQWFNGRRPYSRPIQPSASKELARHPFTPEDANAQANAWLRSPVFQTPTAQRPTAHAGPTLTAQSKTELVLQGGEPQPFPFVSVQDAVPSDIAGTSTSYGTYISYRILPFP
ncbi:Replication protein a kda dna-binding subunit, partial [Daphnia magna]